MKSKIWGGTFFCLLTILSNRSYAQVHNILTPSERDSGFKLLFDGRTIDGKIWKSWENPPRSPMVLSRYAVNAQEEAIQKIGYAANGDIMIDSVYSDFVFKFEFKVTSTVTVGNSGIHYRAFDGKYWASEAGIEYQIMDISDINAGEPTSAAYGIVKPLQANYKMNSGAYNTGKIVAKGDSVQHWLNGKLTVAYDRKSSAFKTAFQSSRFSSHSGTEPITGRTVNFETVKQGWIMIQDYGNGYPWWFRNLKMARLPIPVTSMSPGKSNNPIRPSAYHLGSNVHITIPDVGKHSVQVLNASGHVLHSKAGTTPIHYVLPTIQAQGILFIRVKWAGKTHSLKLTTL